MNPNPRFETLAGLIRERRTVKRFAPTDRPVRFLGTQTEAFDSMVRESVAIAGWSPFHFDRQLDGVPEPWRVQVLWHPACRQLAVKLPELIADWKPGNKLPMLLSACGATILVSWLPVTTAEMSDEGRRMEQNFEHLAATSAYIQNLLLLLTACGMDSYWATANLLDSTSVKARLQSDPRGRLAGAIFVGYPASSEESSDRAFGGNREKRTPSSRWSKELEALSG